VERAQTLDLAGGRGFFEHNWDWGDIQWGRMWAVMERGWLAREEIELNESASFVSYRYSEFRLF
jgi:hypothetical protein